MAEKTLKDFGDKVDSAKASEINAAIEKVREALKGTDNDAIKSASEALQKLVYEVSAAAYQQAQQAQAQQQGQAQSQQNAKNGKDDVVDADYKVVDDDKK